MTMYALLYRAERGLAASCMPCSAALTWGLRRIYLERVTIYSAMHAEVDECCCMY